MNCIGFRRGCSCDRCNRQALRDARANRGCGIIVASFVGFWGVAALILWAVFA